MSSFEDRFQDESNAIYDRICQGEAMDVEAELMDAHLRASDDDSR